MPRAQMSDFLVWWSAAESMSNSNSGACQRVVPLPALVAVSSVDVAMSMCDMPKSMSNGAPEDEITMFA